jgi:MFS family permease
VLILVVMGSVMTFFLGFIQTLSAPMILAFSGSSALGTSETIAASGMLVTSVLIGVLSISGGYARVLSASLFCAGAFMAAFGLREDIVLISVSGFLFFAMLPFANASIDFLLRTNIENSVQGRAWGLIGVISQFGFVAAYALSGVLADYVFTPLLLQGGALAGSVGKIIGTGSGRGTGFLISIAGLLLCVTSVVLYNIKSVRELEHRGALCIAE